MLQIARFDMFEGRNIVESLRKSKRRRGNVAGSPSRRITAARIGPCMIQGATANALEIVEQNLAQALE